MFVACVVGSSLCSKEVISERKAQCVYLNGK